MRDDPEFRLQKAVAQHLMLRGAPNVYYTAIPLGEYRAKRTAAKIKAMGAIAGAPDILVLVNGIAYGLELKAGNRPLSDSQKDTAVRFNQAGGRYYVAHGLDEALDLLTRWGALRPERGAVERRAA